MNKKFSKPPVDPASPKRTKLSLSKGQTSGLKAGAVPPRKKGGGPSNPFPLEEVK